MGLESNELQCAVEKLRTEELVVLLDFAAQWNTNSRTADVSFIQCFIFLVVRRTCIVNGWFSALLRF